jgi:hypothetical protein
MTQQQLRQAMARAHQIAARRSSRARTKVTQRLLLDAGDRDTMKLTGPPTA